jgi:hypothetical protein
LSGFVVFEVGSPWDKTWGLVQHFMILTVDVMEKVDNLGASLSFDQDPMSG